MPICKHRAPIRDEDGRTTYQVLPCHSWSCRACTENYLVPRCRDRCRELLHRSMNLHDVEILYRLEVPTSEWDAVSQALSRSNLDHKTYVRFAGHTTTVAYFLHPFRNAVKVTGARATDAIFRDLARMAHGHHCCTASNDMPNLHEHREPSGKKIIHIERKPTPQGVRLAARLAEIPVSPEPLNPAKALTAPVKLDTRHLSDAQVRDFMDYAYLLSTTEDLADMRRQSFSVFNSTPPTSESFSDTLCPGCCERVANHTTIATLTG